MTHQKWLEDLGRGSVKCLLMGKKNLKQKMIPIINDLKYE